MTKLTDLTTNYLGMTLRNPVVASAGPISQTVSGIRALAGAGVGAVVIYSLFEEQLRREAERIAELEQLHENTFPEAQTYFPSMATEANASMQYLKLVETAVGGSEIPIIASLNGVSVGSWTRTARQLQEAGASAVELNIYYVPGDVNVAGPTVEERHLDILRAVKHAVSIPVAVKLSPYFSSTGNFCRQLDDAGADGLVLFNRFLQPDVNIDRLEVIPGVSLSSPIDGRLPRTWIAVLHGKVRASLAGTSGVDTFEDVVKYILAGADVVMTTSSLLRHGVANVHKLVEGLDGWLTRKELTLDEARGLLAVPADEDTADFERAGYVQALEKAKAVYGSLA